MNRLIFAFALASAAPVAAETPIRPGYWESTNRLLSPISSTSVEQRCITPADIEKFMAGPSNRHYACTYPTRTIADGRIVLKGSCVGKDGLQLQLEGQGVYTPDSFSLSADVATDFLGIPVTGKATTEARRIGDVCPTPPAG